MVIFISKDINLRMKAKSIGIMAQDYENDKVRILMKSIKVSAPLKVLMTG